MTPPPWTRGFDRSPFFQGLAPVTQHYTGLDTWPSLDSLNQHADRTRLRNSAGLPIRFIPQTKRCGQMDYEHQIQATGQVPSREHHWHDFFNALIWLAYPQAKGAINALQCARLPDGQAGRRDPMADAATLFDESGLVLLTQDTRLAQRLRAKQWKAAFWDQRPLWNQARLYVFGHALLEKSFAPLPGITGKCLHITTPTLPGPADPIPAWLDQRIAQTWRDGTITTPAALFPLPLLGVPGFDPANDTASYYDNTSVFRPPRGG